MNNILIDDAELNPELICWHLNYLTELVENNNTDNDRNGFNCFNMLLKQNRQGMNDFIEVIKDHAGQNQSEEFKSKINDILKEFIIISPPSPDKNIILPGYDSNRIYYFEFKYMSGNKGLTYNRDEEYYKLVIQLEPVMKADLMQKLSEMKNRQADISINRLQYLIKYWWLVKKDSAISDYLSSAVRDYTKRVYSARKLGTIEITAGFAYSVDDKWYTHDVVLPGFNSVDYLSETKNYNTFVLQAVYKLHIKELISSFSYINIGLSVSATNSKVINFDNISSNHVYNIIDSYNYSSQYLSASDIKLNQQYYSLNGIISFPFLLVTPELILHVGIKGKVNYYLADVTYNYRSTIYKYSGNVGYLQNDINVPKTQSVSKLISDISPIFEINYNLPLNFLIKFSTSGYNYLSICAGMEF